MLSGRPFNATGAALNIVFITHYFPPLNSSGARRINAFAKYLSGWGHQVTVITTKKSGRDGLLTEAVPNYFRLLEINNLGQISSSVIPQQAVVRGELGVETRSWLGRVLLKIKRAVMKVFGQLVDHRLLFALQFTSPVLATEVKDVLREADVVMSSCPPWPTHLAGWVAKKRFKKCWVADFRDQFSGNHILRGSVVSRPVEVFLERWLLRLADCVTVISAPMKDYYEQFHSDVLCIENGYDENVFEEASLALGTIHDSLDEGELVIRYMGSITVDRIPKVFFQAIAQLNSLSGRRLIVEFYGESTLLRNALYDVAPDVVSYVRFHPQLSYIKAIQAMLTADALFFVETSDSSSHSARGVLTTKLFEYLAAQKPIIAELSPESLAAQYIEQSGLGMVVSTQLTEMLRGLTSLREGNFTPNVNEEFIKSLSRRVKARELEHLLNRLIMPLA